MFGENLSNTFGSFYCDTSEGDGRAEAQAEARARERETLAAAEHAAWVKEAAEKKAASKARCEEEIRNGWVFDTMALEVRYVKRHEEGYREGESRRIAEGTMKTGARLSFFLDEPTRIKIDAHWARCSEEAAHNVRLYKPERHDGKKPSYWVKVGYPAGPKETHPVQLVLKEREDYWTVEEVWHGK